jgi:hypothetical protein
MREPRSRSRARVAGSAERTGNQGGEELDVLVVLEPRGVAGSILLGHEGTSAYARL